MSDARDPVYPVDVPAQPAYDLTPPVTTDAPSKPREVTEQTKQAAGDVKDTAREQAQRVGAEARTQARTVASEVRGKLGEQARTQNTRLVSGIRETADHLDEMRGARQDSPAAAVVARVAEGGRQFADYLDRNGPDGVLREVEDFARRRPGAFLATALAAGFVVGRLGKGVLKADDDPGTGKPAEDTFVSYPDETQDTVAYVPAATGSGYVTPATTQYTATGTGTPAVVDDEPGYRS